MAVNEEGPGIGIWIALGTGLVAGLLVGWPVAGAWGFGIGFVLVALVTALLVS